jgi:uncharacterized protein YlxP (DUF503 family)
MIIGTLICRLQIPGCRSLKEKRGHIKPLLNRLHREFNISAAEIDCQDIWDETVIGCAIASNQRVIAEKCMQQVVTFIENQCNNMQLIDFKIELF